KNRMFAPLAGIPGLASAGISFPNPENEPVQIVIYNAGGKKILQKKFDYGLMSFSWDGRSVSGELPAAGLYIVNIIINGKEKESYKTHIYMTK
ncbi:MAG TPA: hypothetical protein DC049_11985, partial [Spirochaetia bacterium]|nr:hypothetical protein [Spirochaetia bacterium]